MLLMGWRLRDRSTAAATQPQKIPMPTEIRAVTQGARSGVTRVISSPVRPKKQRKNVQKRRLRSGSHQRDRRAVRV